MIAVLFQLALAFGMPWGQHAMGGKFPGRLPPVMRIAAVIQAVLLCLMTLVVMVRSQTLASTYYEHSLFGIWVVVGISAISFVMNLITPMKWERIIWAPVGALLFTSSLLIAMS